MSSNQLIRISDVLICSKDFINSINLIQISEFEYGLSDDRKITKYAIELSNVTSPKKMKEKNYIIYGKEYIDNDEAKKEMNFISQKINEYRYKSLVNISSHFWYDLNLTIESIYVCNYAGNYPKPPESYIIIICFPITFHVCWASGKQYDFDEAKLICNEIYTKINQQFD